MNLIFSPPGKDNKAGAEVDLTSGNPN